MCLLLLVLKASAQEVVLLFLTFSLLLFYVYQYTAAFLTCDDELGMENGDIPNQNIKASSRYKPYYTDAHNARLNNGGFYWVAAKHDSQPWIQVDIGYQTNVSGVVTKGFNDFIQIYVTSFTVSTFLSSINDEELFVEDASGKAKVNINSNMYFQPWPFCSPKVV